MFRRIWLLAFVLGLAAAFGGGTRQSSADTPPVCTTITCAIRPGSSTSFVLSTVAQFTVQVTEPFQSTATIPGGSLETGASSPSPSPGPLHPIQVLPVSEIEAANPSPSPSPSSLSVHPILAIAASPSPSASPASPSPTPAPGVSRQLPPPTQVPSPSPSPAPLTPTLTNGKNVLTLTAAESGRTAVVPRDTSIFLRFAPGDYQISVDPPTGVLEAPTGAFALPKDDIGLLVSVGRGAATITVSAGPAARTAGPSTSGNWSGYTAASTTYTGISGSWEVPAVQSSAAFTASSTWIGIDGSSNTNLIQTGTEQDYTPGSGASYYAWWEILPAPETTISTSSYPVNPGDGMTAQISQQTGGKWSISISDTTAGWTFSTQQLYSGPLSSAEWIEEATAFPTGAGGALVPATLAGYGSTPFDSGTDNGANPALTASEQVAMVQGGSQVSTPSAPDCEADGFNVAFGASTPAAPACPPPPPTFNQLTFNIATGGDNLRGDSSATASVALPGGTQTFTLKAQSDGEWPNGSDNVRMFPVAGPDQLVSAIGPITITLTSHNGTFETDDNWNLESVYIQADGATGSACVYNQSGDPLSRLTGSGPSVTLNPGTGC